MTFPVQIRGVQPRSFKLKSGETRHALTFVLLDLSPDRPVMDTMRLTRDCDSEAEQKRLAGVFAGGKTGTAVVTGLRVNFDGEPVLQGDLEAASK